ncbi:MAG: PA14 domain-containing protein, partial [Planctomycetota bacterium]
MCKQKIFTIIGAAIFALAVGQAQGVDIPVPNGTFHMYKPGTNYTVVGTAPDDIWVQQIGDNRPLSSSTPVPFADGTSGLEIDCPGWVTPILSQGSMTNTCDLFTLGYEPTDGSSVLNAFGAWSGQNGTLAESAESLGNVEIGMIYTVSGMLNGSGGPFILELRGGGVPMPISSSVNPISSSGGTSGWEVISTTYIADMDFVGEPITIVCGTKRPGPDDDPLYGTRSRLDNVTLTATKNYKASNPDPADGSLTPPTGPEGDGYYMTMTFSPGYGATTHTAYFSSNFDDVNDRNAAVELGSPPYGGMPGYETTYYVGLDDPAVPEFARTPLERGVTYYWAVDESNGVGSYPGDVWSYTIASDAAGSPTPADGAKHVIGDPSLTLSWELGNITNPDDYSISYDVYWGTDREAVEAGTSDTINVIDLTHTIGPLSGETDYYWKVDTRLTKIVPPFDTKIIEGAVWQFTTAPPGVGYILREVWNDITGTAVSDLTSDPRYPDSPDSSELLTSFEGPTNSGVPNNYGSRLHGWLCVAETGYYTFWIATDDNGELWLSTDANPANAVLISWVSGWTTAGDFDDPDVTPSEPILLEGGQEYYISGLMKEGTGGDNIAAAWECLDNGLEREVIPGYHLKPYVPVTAKNPYPAHDSVDVAVDVTLTWDAGIDAS